MATENAVMAAAVAEGASRIANAASEPHVQGLCRLLVAMGADVRGIGTNVLEVEGVPELRPASHRIGPDHIEVGSLMAIAAMTGGELTIRGVAPDDLRMILMVFRRLGVEAELRGTDLRVTGKQDLVVQDDLPRWTTLPGRAFPAISPRSPSCSRPRRAAPC
jgi:UDP-N-acetylglucosamine 1-carboxyvinyltransferase